MKPKGTKRTCTRGHAFYKSSDCPVCPVCWTGYYRQKSQGDFPDKLSAPALRALLSAKIYNLRALSKHSEAEVLALHGMGPASLPILHAALKEKNLEFRA